MLKKGERKLFKQQVASSKNTRKKKEKILHHGIKSHEKREQQVSGILKAQLDSFGPFCHFLFPLLPAEVSLSIFVALSLNDHLSLCLVCHSWKSQLQTRNLLPLSLEEEPSWINLSWLYRSIRPGRSRHSRRRHPNFQCFEMCSQNYAVRQFRVQREIFSPIHPIVVQKNCRRFVFVRELDSDHKKLDWPCLYFELPKYCYNSIIRTRSHVVYLFLAFCREKELWKGWRMNLAHRGCSAQYIKIDFDSDKYWSGVYPTLTEDEWNQAGKGDSYPFPFPRCFMSY